MAVALSLMGCDSDPLAVFDKAPPAPQTAEQADARQRAEGAMAAAEAAPTPDLRDVPDRPTAATTMSTRDKVVEGLIADRKNARYTDEAIRLQGTGRQSVAPAPAVPEPPKPETPAAVAATTAAASAVRREATPSVNRPAADAAVAAARRESQLAAALPPTPRPPTPRPPTPRPPTPRPPTPVPPAPAPAPSAPPSVGAPVPSSTPGPLDRPSAVTPSDSAVVVDRSALDALGSRSASSPAPRVTDGDQVATIQFAYSSSSLNARDRDILRQVAAIQRQSGGSLVIVGHASSRTRQLDKVAHEMANLKISMARANAVAEVLVASGVPRDRVVVEAVANARPVYAEAMPTGEAGNRRAEIFLVR